MATPVEALTLQVQSNAADSGKIIRSLADSLSALKNSTKGGFRGVEKAADALSTLAEKTSNVNGDGADNVKTLATALSSLGGIKISATIGTQLDRINKAVNEISLPQVVTLGELAKHLQTIGNVGPISVPGLGSLKKLAQLDKNQADYEKAVPADSDVPTETAAAASRLSGVGRIIEGLGKPFDIAAAAGRGAATAVAGFGAKIHSAATHAKSAWTAIVGFSNAIKGKFTLGLLSGENALSKLFSAFKRIALYRAIRFLFSQLTNAMKEGINNLYQYSSLMGTEFAGSMDRLATSFLYLKNSMGAAASPLINALAPAIDFAIDKIVELLNWFNQLVSRLRGASTWTKAVKYATSYAGATERAAGSTRKAAKALKDYTIGIDELNVIRPDDDTGSGGGGGGGAATPDYSKMFEEAPIDEGISDFADRLKEAFNKSDWKGLGTLIGDKFNGIINSIKWAKIGKKLGKAFNGAVQTIYYTLDTISWTNIGDKVATLLNNALSEIDFGFVGRILVKGVTIGLDLFIGFITKLDFGRVANAVSQFLIGAMDEAAKWIQGVDWAKLGNDLFAKLIDFVSNIDWAGVVGTAFELVGSIIGGGAALLGGFFGDAWEKLKSYFTDNGEFTWEGFLDGIVNGLKSIGTWIVDNIFTPFLDGFKNAFGIASPSKEMMTMGDYVIEGLLKGITDALSNIGTWVKDNIFSPIWNNILKAFGINSGESKETEKQGKALPAGLYSGTRKSIPGGQSTFTSWATKTLSWFSGSGSNSTQNKFGSEGEGVVKSFNKKTGVSAFSTKDIMTTWAGNIKTWFSTEASADSFSTFALNVVDGFKNGISNFGSRVYETVTGWAKNVKKWFSNEMDEHSPSKVFYGFGENVVLGFNNAITDVGRTSLRTVQDWSASIQRGFAPMLSVDYSNIAGMNDYVGAMSATASYNASVQAEASFVDESLMPVLQAIAEATTRQANKSETAVVRVNGRDLLSAMDTQRKANGYRVAY